jgi:SAM-dependent methyltransferase
VPDEAGLRYFYDGFTRVAAELQAELDREPARPLTKNRALWDLLDSLGLPSCSHVVDVGCGDGRQSIHLAMRYGFNVTAVDPVPTRIEAAQARLAEHHELDDRVRFIVGRAEALPVDEESVDLVWCKGSLLHVPDIDKAYSEVSRVLRRGGHALVFQKFSTPHLEPQEADRLFGGMQIAPQSVDPERVDLAIRRAGLQVESIVTIDQSPKDDARNTRLLLHASRLFREPQRFIDQFGQAAYDTILGKCLFHIYPLIGKLEPRVLLLTRPRG